MNYRKKDAYGTRCNRLQSLHLSLSRIPQSLRSLAHGNQHSMLCSRRLLDRSETVWSCQSFQKIPAVVLSVKKFRCHNQDPHGVFASACWKADRCDREKSIWSVTTGPDLLGVWLGLILTRVRAPPEEKD